ncbi:MAG: acylneuraminate cytidylyltransferase family protein [Phycisphaerae bacterium]
MKVLAVIPARSGSKRIPGKNTASLADRPLIAYTCQAAREAEIFDAIYVNTDCSRIAGIAAQYGVSCPILRPRELATDETSTDLAMRFFISALVEQDDLYDAVMLLQPTSPLRNAEDIRAAFALFEQNRPCTVVSVTHVTPASWLGRVTKDGQFEPFVGNDPVYRLNGAIYVHPFEYYLDGARSPKHMMYPMPVERSVDIDTIDDWQVAEMLMQQQHTYEYNPV